MSTAMDEAIKAAAKGFSVIPADGDGGVAGREHKM